MKHVSVIYNINWLYKLTHETCISHLQWLQHIHWQWLNKLRIVRITVLFTLGHSAVEHFAWFFDCMMTRQVVGTRCRRRPKTSTIGITSAGYLYIYVLYVFLLGQNLHIIKSSYFWLLQVLGHFYNDAINWMFS